MRGLTGIGLLVPLALVARWVGPYGTGLPAVPALLGMGRAGWPWVAALTLLGAGAAWWGLGYPQDVTLGFAMVAGYAGLPCVAWLLAAQRRAVTADGEVRQREVEAAFRAVHAEHTEVVHRQEVLEQQIHDTASLYEITKTLSPLLDVGTLATALHKALHGRLPFTAGCVILAPGGAVPTPVAGGGTESPRPAIRLARLEPGTGAQAVAAVLPGGPAERVVLERLQTHRAPICTAGDARGGWEGLAVPCWVEEQLIGAVVLEGTPETESSRLQILAGQVALALKRIVLYEVVQELAITDGLTGCYVRRYLVDRLGEELERAERHGLELAFLMADLDQFKSHNDAHGHLVGDVLLREVAQRARRSVREIDLLGRYGGEEFAVILPSTDLRGALQVAERIRQTVAGTPCAAYDVTVALTVSVGVATFPQDATTVEDLIERADQALYRAKTAGRNRVTAWEKGMAAGGITGPGATAEATS